MARTYSKNIRRTLTGTRSRFLAIFAIVALGVGFLAGLLSTSPDIEDSMEEYLDNSNLYDFRVVSTLGLTDADLDAIRALNGVDRVQGGYSADLFVSYGSGDVLVARAHSLPGEELGGPEGEEVLNRLMLVEGRWPEADNECLVSAGGGVTDQRLDVGSTITLTQDNEDLEDKMACTRFTIVGRVRDAYYFSFEREPASIGSGSVGLVFYARPGAFAYSAYTELMGTVTGAKELRSLSDEYKETVRTVTDEIDAISDGRCTARYEEVRSDAQQAIDDAWAEYNDAREQAEAELADAARQLQEGRDALADGERELDDARRQYEDGSNALTGNEALVKDGLTAIAGARGELADGLARIYENMDLLQDGEAQLAQALQVLRDSQRQYEEGLARWEDGRTQYEDGLAQYADGLAQWQAGKEQLDAAEAQYQAGLAQYEAGAASLEQLRQLNAAQKGLDQAAEQGVPEWLYSDTALELLDTILANEQYQALSTAYADRQAARQAYDAAVQAAADAGVEDPEQDPAVQQARQELDRCQAAWQQALEDAVGGYVDVTDPQVSGLIDAVAEYCAQKLPSAEEIEQLRQLNLAKKSIDVGIYSMIASGAAANEEEARALFSDDAIANAQAQLDDAKAQLDAGRPALDEAKAQLDATKAQLDDAKVQLDAAKAEVASGKAELDSAKAQLDAGWATYFDKSAELAAGRAQLNAAHKTLDDGYATLVDKQLQLADALQQIGDAKARLVGAKLQIEAGRATLAEKKQQLLDGEIDYETAKAEVDAELEDARRQIEDAQAELDKIESPKWYIWDRQSNVSFASFKGNVNKVAALAKVFPVFFFLVAALVVLTTMTRMVEEERLQIGTMKALGYGKSTIMSKYLIYSMSAACLGAAVGLALGFTVFPVVIWNAYAMMYWMPAFHFPWRWNYAILAGGSLIGCALIATVAACRATLRENPAQLMRPRAPKAGKRVLLEYITPVWRRMKFSHKVTVRNLFRYKKRFWMTVIGVAGCTSLLVAGFGIADSLDAIVTRQYGDVYHYDLMTTVQHPEDVDAGAAHDVLFGGGEISASTAAAIEKANQTLPDGSTAEAYLMVPGDLNAFGRFADLHERISRDATPVGATGVVVTEKYAELLGCKAGDSITVYNNAGNAAQVTVSGVCEHYVSNYLYMSAGQYRAAFGEEPGWNTILSIVEGSGDQSTRDAISARLLGLDEVTSVTFTEDATKTVLNMLNSVNAVVVVVVICAAALALVVLYNLSNINIAERVKEIATIKVLGFYDREVSAYVNRESTVLTVVGALIGLWVGTILHRYVVYTVEVDYVMFGRTVDPSSYFYALALTLLFGAAVNLLMSRKLKAISMVESMKAPE